MNLYLISQDANDDYDTYDAAVVAAESEEEAKLIHPSGRNPAGPRNYGWDSWVQSPEQIKIQLIGTANEGTPTGVICASYNAG